MGPTAAGETAAVAATDPTPGRGAGTHSFGSTATTTDRLVTVDVVPWDDVGAAGLRDAQRAEVAERYGEEEPGPAPTGEHVLANVVVRLDGRAVGCGAVQEVTGWYPELGPGRVGEIKRIYVAPAARGRGLGHVILRELHARARADGLTHLVLETGDLLVEASGLYRAHGYTPIARYGPYVPHETSACYEVHLRLEG